MAERIGKTFYETWKDIKKEIEARNEAISELPDLEKEDMSFSNVLIEKELGQVTNIEAIVKRKLTEPEKLELAMVLVNRIYNRDISTYNLDAIKEIYNIRIAEDY